MTRTNEPPSACPKVEICRGFFTAMQFAPAAGVWQALFCNASFETCERYRAVQADQPVSPSLPPSGRRSVQR